MKNKNINLLGWFLFIISAIGFTISSIGSFWAMFGSLFFLIDFSTISIALSTPAQKPLGAESNIFNCLFFIFFNKILKQYMWKGQRRQTYKYDFKN